ncbi:MAG: IPTL-CTERM sorting domain-containing protein [Proteobacteria bacterium]|nr:IPTL-CTERM sorting domain-containing protein [Pseudomonadota bacterium]
MKNWFIGAAATLGFFLASLTASAQVLYGTTGAGGTPSTLVEVSPTDGSLVRTIGPVGYSVNGLTFDASTQTLYAITRQNDAGCPRGLLTINIATGAGTVVGCGPASGEGPALLTSNSSGELYSWLEPSTDDLIRWNKSTGTYSAPIGDSGLSTGEHTLAFDTSNTLYLLNNGSLYTISTSSGAATLVRSGMSVGHHGAFNPTSNRLYVIAGTSDPRTIRVLDVSTGAQDNEFAAPNGLHTLAFARSAVPPASVASVPTLSQSAMVLLGLLMGATLILRRHRS